MREKVRGGQMSRQPSAVRNFARWLSGVSLLTAVTFLSMRAAQAPAAPATPPADLVLRGGKVITLDSADRVAQAIAVRGNRIVAVGTDAEIQRLTGPATRVIQLQGRAVTPGFIDSHTHVESTAEFHRFWIDLHSPPLPAEHSSAAIMRKLSERVAQVPPGTWVVGQGPFGPQVPPKASELSAAFPDHPVVVKYGMHQYVANRKALEMANITKFTPDPPGGKIERGADGELTGMLYECFELFPIPYPRNELKQALETTLNEDFLKQGVTTVYELSVTPAANGLYQELHDEGKLPVRLHIGYMIYPALQPVIDLESLLKMSIHTGFGDDWLRIGPAKLFVNGAGAGVPLIRRDQASLNQTALRLHHAGWQLWIHAIGEPAQDMALEALETVLRADPRPDPRHRIEHIGGVLDQPRLDRMKRLGLIPVPTEPALPFTAERGAAGEGVLFPYHTLLAMGFQPPGNSDTGGSYSWQMNVIARLAMFVTRMNEDGTTYHPEEAISVTQALRILSTYGAYAGFEEKTRGTLEPGKLADLVVLSEDPLAIPAARLKDLKIDATIIDGALRFERK
jgi:predicted amidohydrolase YtcJ